MRWLRFTIGLIIALTLHSLLDSFFPNALAFFQALRALRGRPF